MTYYYNPETGQYAKVLGVDDRTDIAVVMIDDKRCDVDWQVFLKEFKSLCSVRSSDE